jgi:hypothetical protein
VTVLWSRLGVPLPEAKYFGAISKAPVTGTEWEFEDAVASYQQRGLPELLLYRKRAKVTVELGDRAILEEQQHQSELVEEFMRHCGLATLVGGQHHGTVGKARAGAQQPVEGAVLCQFIDLAERGDDRFARLAVDAVVII